MEMEEGLVCLHSAPVLECSPSPSGPSGKEPPERALIDVRLDRVMIDSTAGLQNSSGLTFRRAGQRSPGRCV